MTLMIFKETSLLFIIFKVKTSLGTLSKTFVGIELKWHLTLVWVKSARVTAIWISKLHEITTFEEIVYEYDKKHSQ